MVKKKYVKPICTKGPKLSDATADSPVSSRKTTAPSDRRYKTDIIALTIIENGLQLYAFRYIWSKQRFVGVMAQDILEIPEFSSAVSLDEHGFYQVDYRVIGLEMITYEQWKLMHIAPVSGDVACVAIEPAP